MTTVENMMGFIRFLLSGCAPITKYSLELLIKFTAINENAVAIAAPTTPKGGIKIAFNTIFTTTTTEKENKINRVLPAAINGEWLGPVIFLIMYPMINILRTFVAGIYVGPNKVFIISPEQKNKIKKSGKVDKQSHFVKIEQFLFISPIFPLAYNPETIGTKTKDIEALEENLAKINSIEGVARTHTLVCLSSYEFPEE